MRAPFGLSWVVAASVAASALSYPIVAAVTWPEFGGKHLYYLRPTVETIIATGVMAAGVLLLAHILPTWINGLLAVSIKAAAGAALYGAISIAISPDRMREIGNWAVQRR